MLKENIKRIKMNLQIYRERVKITTIAIHFNKIDKTKRLWSILNSSTRKGREAPVYAWNFLHNNCKVSDIKEITN